MWIKSLRLENFQSYKDQTINLHPHFNVLVGTGNSGKSAVVRALSFILYGKWDSSWIKHNAKSCRITLITDSDAEVIREKGAKINKYVVRVPGSKEQVYESFGTKVPEEVQKVTGIFKVIVGDKDELTLNLSNQLDQLFLLSNTGSFRAKVLGKLSKAHYLDFALRNINRDKKRLSTEKSVLEKQKVELETELLEYTDLEAKKDKLKDLGYRLDGLAEASSKIEKLKVLSHKAQVWKKSFVSESKRQKTLESVDVSKVVNFLERVESYKKLMSLISEIRSIDSNLETLSSSLNKIENDSLDGSKRYVELLKDNNKCPTCFSDITPETLNKFLETVGA